MEKLDLNEIAQSVLRKNPQFAKNTVEKFKQNSIETETRIQNSSSPKIEIHEPERKYQVDIDKQSSLNEINKKAQDATFSKGSVENLESKPIEESDCSSSNSSIFNPRLFATSRARMLYKYSFDIWPISILSIWIS